MVYRTRVNALMLRALDAELVLVGSPRGETPAELASAMAIAAHGFGAGRAGAQGRLHPEPRHGRGRRGARGRAALRTGSTRPAQEEDLGAAEIAAYRAALEAEKLRPVAIVPSRGDLAAPRVKDLAEALGATRAPRRRPRPAAHPPRRHLRDDRPERAARRSRPGTLLITPGDRSDILAAASLAVLGGTPLAGLLLTGGARAGRARVRAVPRGASRPACPSSPSTMDSYPAASAVAAHDPRRSRRTTPSGSSG